MAACVSHEPQDRGPRDHRCPAAGGGCSNVVDGRAVISAPRPGSPIQWAPCKAAVAGCDRACPPAPSAACCRCPSTTPNPTVTSPQIAMIRFPATGHKIGSLVINPGGPGESGVEAAASLVHTLPPSVRERFDLVGFDPRGVAKSTPAVWCNSDADNDRLRADPHGRLHARPASTHIEKENQGVRPALRRQDGQGVPGERRNRERGQGSRRHARRRFGDEKLTYLGYSYGTRIGALYAEAFPQKVRAMILDGAVDPNADPIEEEIRQAAAFQKAFDNYAADCAKQPGLPARHRPGQGRGRVQEPGRPAGRSTRRRRRIRAG